MSGCKGGSGNPANGLSTKAISIVWYIPGDVKHEPVITADESANYIRALMFEGLCKNQDASLDMRFGFRPRSKSSFHI